MACKVELVKTQLLNFWNYNLKNNDCVICRQTLTCNSLLNEEKGIKSFVSEGVCGHAFHDDCIIEWLKNYDGCPLCGNLKWKYLQKGICINGVSSTKQDVVEEFEFVQHVDSDHEHVDSDHEHVDSDHEQEQEFKSNVNKQESE
jgi:RING-box protein 1